MFFIITLEIKRKVQATCWVQDDPIQLGFITWLWAKLASQLNTLVRATLEIIEGSNTIEVLIQEESSSVNAIRVNQDIGQKTCVRQGVGTSV